MYLKQFFLFYIIGKHQEKSNRKIKNVEHSLCEERAPSLIGSYSRFLFRICFEICFSNDLCGR